jgi:hypothetical protein
MFNARTSAKTLLFPVLDDAPVVRPAWLEDMGAPAPRLVFPPNSDEATRPPSLSPSERHSTPPRPSEMPATPPSAAPASHSSGPGTPQEAAMPAPQPTPHPETTSQAHSDATPHPAGIHVEPEAHEPHLEERVWSKLPPPPQLGSLIPGARSAPPPANDTGLELLTEQREAFTNAAVELGIARAATLSVLEGQLLDLSIEIASALIEREIEVNPELHGALARAALNSLGDSERVTLRTSPEAYQAICQTLGGPEATVRGVQVQVHADDAIPGLGCVVDGENVRIDATVAERLRAVRRAFEDERRKAAESSE